MAAENDCRDDTANAITHLPVFRAVSEIGLFADHYFSSPFRPPYLQAGYARNIEEVGAFRAVTGESIDPMLWGESEPNNQGGADTVTGVEADSRRLDDFAPTRSFAYVCVCDGVPAVAVFRL